MDIIQSPAEMQHWAAAQALANQTIALVPTMGYFHEGHLSLMRLAANLCDLVVVSLFVNPTQFGPNEDLDRYPRDFERDMELVRGEQVAAVFAPTPALMYPPGSQTEVRVRDLATHLCGRSRPAHFAGVATVVTKLFNIVQPDVAVFGEKDFQQLAIIRRLVRAVDRVVFYERRKVLAPRSKALLKAWKRVHIPFSMVLLVTMLVHIGIALGLV